MRPIALALIGGLWLAGLPAGAEPADVASDKVTPAAVPRRRTRRPRRRPVVRPPWPPRGRC